jgi:peptidoglycan-associated lipoprotein
MTRYRGLLLVVCVGLSVTMVSGCRKSRVKDGAGNMPGRSGSEVLDPFDEGTYSMDAARFDLGVPVDDVSFQSVAFNYDSYQIAPSEYGKIDVVAQYMTENSDVHLVTEGHCDERGSREYNMALGENRAQAVRAYLINVGVDKESIQTRSHGEEVPIDFDHTESSWSQNRRVEFSLFR